MVNNFRTCKFCGKIFSYMGKDLCPQCIRDLENKFTTIREYLYKHPGASVAQVSEDTEVDEKMILYFLREGRLEMKNAGGFLSCEKCGASITTGRLCKQCMNSLSSALGNAVSSAHQTASQQKEPESRSKSRATTDSKGNRLHVDIEGR